VKVIVRLLRDPEIITHTSDPPSAQRNPQIAQIRRLCVTRATEYYYITIDRTHHVPFKKLDTEKMVNIIRER